MGRYLITSSGRHSRKSAMREERWTAIVSIGRTNAGFYSRYVLRMFFFLRFCLKPCRIILRIFIEKGYCSLAWGGTSLFDTKGVLGAITRGWRLVALWRVFYCDRWYFWEKWILEINADNVKSGSENLNLA